MAIMCKIKNKIEMDVTMQEIQDLDAQIKQLNALREEKVSKVKSFMGDRVNVLTENFDVKNTPYSSKRFDTKTFKVNEPKLYDMYLTVTESTRFTYQVRERLDESTN